MLIAWPLLGCACESRILHDRGYNDAGPEASCRRSPRPIPRAEPTGPGDREPCARRPKGRPVVLNFWATWCRPCQQEIPHLNRLAKESSGDGLLVIGVSEESQETLRDLGRKEAITYPLVSSDDLPPPFDVIDAVPTTAFIDREGIVRKAVVGYQDYEALKARALAH